MTVRVALVNVESGEEVEVLANPTELQETRKVAWSRQPVPGLSHRPLHYGGTENTAIRVSFWVDAHIAGAEGGAFDVVDFENFCRSFTVPRVSAGVVDDGPPRLLFVWPAISILAVVESVDVRATQFDESGGVIRADVTFELAEARDVRRSSQDIRAIGDLAS